MKIKIKLNIGGSFQNNDAINESSTPDLLFHNLTCWKYSYALASVLQKLI